MKRILIVEESILITGGIINILIKMGFSLNEIESVHSFDAMQSLINNSHYNLVFYGLKTTQNKEIKSLLDVVKKHPTIPFMFFSEPMLPFIQKKMYKGGLKGTINKMASERDITFAIQKVLANEVYIDTSSALKIIFSHISVKRTFDTLSQKENQVAKLLATGNTNTQIVKALNLRPSTVSTYKKRIFNKLKVNNVIDLKNLSTE